MAQISDGAGSAAAAADNAQPTTERSRRAVQYRLQLYVCPPLDALQYNIYSRIQSFTSLVVVRFPVYIK